MIALVGDQPLPNFIAVKHFGYDKVLLVYTEERETQYKYLRAVLEKKRGVVVKEVVTEAHYVNKIAQTVHEELTHLGIGATEKLVFNLTGGTKAMAMAAFHVAQWRDAEMLYLASQVVRDNTKVRAYQSKWHNQQIKPGGQISIPDCIELEDVFDLHLGMGNWEECGPSKDINGGGPFESLLKDTLCRYQKDVNEVKAGVKTLNRQVDMDLVVRLGNHYGIIEAKSGGKGAGMKGLQQLSTSKSLMGTYSRAFHVITVAASSEHKELREALGFTSISLQSYDEHTNTISPDDEEKLLTEIKDAFLELPGAVSEYV